MISVRKVFLSAIIALVAVVLSSSAFAGVSFNVFYSNLSPHGTWLVSAEYGRVWQPYDYGRGWNPYYDGHWVYADVGWTWVSDYEWGDVTYHYGTWFDDPALGWVWIPGYVWAPAWVVFRTGPDYIGWAPVSPRFSVGASLRYGAPAGPFIFVSNSHFCELRVRRYIVPERRVRTIINETRVVNNLVVEKNIVVNRGPDPRMIERASGRKLHVVPIESVPRVAPGGGVTRSVIAIDSHQRSQGLRVAHPVPERRSQKPGHQQSGQQQTGHQHEKPGPRSATRAPAPPPAPTAHSHREPAQHEQAPADSPKRSEAKPKPKPKGHGKPNEPGKPPSS